MSSNVGGPLFDLVHHLGSDVAPLRLMYGVASGANTVTLDGSTTELTLPAIVAVVSGDYVAVLGVGSDRLILGPVT